MIRKLQEKDIEEINALGNLLSPNFAKTTHLEEIEEDKYTKVLVYEEEGMIKGFLMYTELEDTVDILDIIVKEEYRRHNIASCLIDSMMSNIQESVKLVTLEVRKENIPAIELYKKFGFEIVTTRKNYYQNQEDAYLMGRRLEP